MPRRDLYTPELGDRIISLMSEGKALQDIAVVISVARQTIADWGVNPEHSDQAFIGKYARARVDGCHSQFERIREIEGKLEREEFEDPQNARILLDSMKWRLSKMLPGVYGERQHIEHSGEVKTSPKDHAPEWMLDKLNKDGVQKGPIGSDNEDTVH